MSMKEAQTFRLPYGQDFIEVTLPKDRVQAILSPKPFNNNLSEEDTIINALKNPINSPSLRELVKGKKHILIITNDNTRPNTSRVTFPLLLEEIKLGNPLAQITTLIATGLHSNLTKEEIEEKFSSEILNTVNIITHDAYNEVVYLSKLSTGTEFWANKVILESDLIIAEGNIEPHFFAGFTGGSKSILPGISGYKTIFSNHSAQMIDHPKSKNGILDGNPIYMEMCEAASNAGLTFILNVILGENSKVVKAFSGNPVDAHKVGADFIRRHTLLSPSFAEITITSNSGYPLDRNVYQLVKGISVAAETTRPGGVIIIAAECRDGVGHPMFYKLLSGSSSPFEILEKIRNKGIYCADQWQVQMLAKILEKYKVIVVTNKLDKGTIEAMHMLHATSIQEALDIAFILKGKESKVTIIPEGPKTIIQGGKS